MLLDADSLDLAKEIEAILAAVPAELRGPGEARAAAVGARVATTPCADRGRGGRAAAGAAPPVAEIAERAALAGGLGDPSVRALGGRSGSSIAPATRSWSRSSASSPARS